MGYIERVTLSGAKPPPRSGSASQTRLEVALLTDVGQVRPMNEDSGTAIALPEGGLFVVADGMGGHNAGDVASQMAVRLLQENYLSHLPQKGDAPRRPTPERLVRTLEEVNRQVYAEASRPDRRGMGTTLTALAVDGPNALIANVGDSRVYLLRGGVLTRLTRDHSWVAEQQRRGLLSEEEARNHRWRSVISNALGSTGDLKLDLSGLKLEAGDLFLLCSDGLTGVLEDDQLAPFLSAELPLERVVRNLIDAANAGGGPDNITALLVRVESVAPEPKVPAYELPTLQGDGPVLARSLLGTDSLGTGTLETTPLRPTVSNLPFVIALYLVLIGVIVAPDPYRTYLVPVLFIVGGLVVYGWWRQRQGTVVARAEFEGGAQPTANLDADADGEDDEDEEDSRGGFSSRF